MDRTKTLALCIAVAVAGCSRQRGITVGSKPFTESVLLGEIVAQHLEKKLGQPVARKLNLGGTLLAHQALLNGEIDLYPEYTGTALTAVLKLPIDSDAALVERRVRDEYLKRWNLDWLPSLGFNNTFAMIIRGEDARRDKIETLSQAAARKQRWRLGIGYEFETRADGLKGLQATYNLPLEGSPKNMDLGLLYKALEQKQVDMIAAATTDGLISAMNVVVLRDDRSYFPPYHAAIVVRSDSLERHPGLRQALLDLSGKFSDEEMRKLNHEVDGKHRTVEQVARDWLAGLR